MTKRTHLDVCFQRIDGFVGLGSVWFVGIDVGHDFVVDERLLGFERKIRGVQWDGVGRRR
jgi:hypothetical protein